MIGDVLRDGLTAYLLTDGDVLPVAMACTYSCAC
jgi:hypothetical protein